MAEETTVDTVEEVESSRTQQSLDAFQEMLDSRPDEPRDEEVLEDTEQPADEADDDAGDEPTDDSPESKEKPAAEGPSATLKTVARQAKVPAELVAIARDDQQLQAIIDAHLDAQEAGEGAEKDEPEPENQEPEKDFFEFPIAEDEFDDTDPVHKAFKTHVERSNELVKDLHGKLGLFARFANEQIKREQEREQAQQQELSQKFYGPLDSALDDFGSDVFGKTGSLTKSQLEVRKAVAEKYAGLATLDADEDEKLRLAELAIRAYSRDLAERRDKAVQSEKKQPRMRTGGGGNVRPSAKKPSTRDEKIALFDQERREREANRARA